MNFDGTNVPKNLLPGVPIVESPFFNDLVDGPGFDDETRAIARDLNEKGFAVIDFPDDDFDNVADAIKADLNERYDWASWMARGYDVQSGLRIIDGWRFNPNVKRLAVNQRILQILAACYGRRAFPFQTLNFPVGTQQHFHSDSLHFSSVPERFMCGVWVALEDIDESCGPLVYYPGSHKWPIYTNEHIGNVAATSDVITTQEAFDPLWDSLVSASKMRPETFIPRKGQALIWAANLLHGGNRQADKYRTRWSQVTHYFFDGCSYYTPMMSDPFFGSIDFRDIVDVTSGETVAHNYNSAPIDKDFIRSVKYKSPDLPREWDAELYLKANPDVAAAGADAATHYLAHGKKEGRRLR